ncbi:MAG: TRAP transporter large permease [Aminivibrio sp.]|jgi:C4-dicarboxylate transporter DctM subunit
MHELFTDPAFWLLFLFLVPLLLKFPIAMAMGASAAFVIWFWDMGWQSISYSFFANIAKVPLLAIPFFILAGAIMEKAGIAERLINFVKECVGSVSGGLAIGTILVATFWGAISGSGPATVAVIGVILIPGMVKAGYDKAFATSVVSVSSGIAIIIPPSISFLVYASITGVSIGALFAAGFIPGLIMSGCLCVSAWLTSRKNGWKGEPRKGNFWQALRDAFWAIMSPVIILGGIYGGVFTPTEAAAISIFYGLFVGVFIYRSITWRALYELLSFSAITSAVVMILIGMGGLYSWAAQTVGLIDKVAALLLSISDNQYVVLLIINVILLIAGMLIGGNSIFYIFIPLFIPVVSHFGWDPIWFGVICTVNIAIGQITPPVAANLFVGMSISGLTMEQLTPRVMPLVLASVTALAIIAAFPSLTLFLPRLWGLM